MGIATATDAREQSSTSGDELQAFAALDPIDTHVHAFQSDPAFADLMARLRLHVLDICVADTHGIYGDWPPNSSARRISCDPVKIMPGSASPSTHLVSSRKTLPRISSSAPQIATGAVAVKIWKNIGMELRRPTTATSCPTMRCSNPSTKITADNKTLIAHLAEPSSCWQAPNPDSPDYDYYKENPEWYMYLHPDHPRKEVILAARDHLLPENPKLRVVGAHLGSMETDVDEIAKRFDRYPNFAVDTAARMTYLMIQPRAKVRNFLIKYQDRVLYGTDLEFLNNESTPEALKEWQETYARDWKFLATDQILQYKSRQIEGLNSSRFLARIYHDNAVRWLPGSCRPRRNKVKRNCEPARRVVSKKTSMSLTGAPPSFEPLVVKVK